MASDHQSIDDLHEFGGIGVARSTLWRWRMVVLQALSDPDPKPLSGVVEECQVILAQRPQRQLVRSLAIQRE